MCELDALANTMFRVFARCEYALWAAGYHQGEGTAQPDWTGFATAVEPILANCEDAELQAAIAYFNARPPKKQVVRDDVLDWSEEPPQAVSEADRVLLYVRRVRNNLFHGGKFNGRWFEPQRSEELLRHSLVILDACVKGSPPVREAYEQE
jgi:hypothetical protein